MDARAEHEWDVEIQRRRDMLLNYMLLLALAGGLIAIASLALGLYKSGLGHLMVVMAPFLAGWLIVLVVWAWRRLGYRVRSRIFILLTYALGCLIFARGGLPGSGRVWMLLIPALAFVLLGLRSGVAAGFIALLTYSFFVVAISQKWVVPQVAEDLTTLSPLIAEGGSFLLVTVILTAVLLVSNHGWRNALQKMGAAHDELRARAHDLAVVNEQLERQSAKLRMAAEVARAGSSILNPKDLFTNVVNRIQEGFESLGVYYVGLFSLERDEGSAEQVLVLRAATGEAGKLLLEMGHKLPLDDKTSVGWCVTHRKARIVTGMDEGTVQFDALPMPHTRSEISLPLRSREHNLGALNVHSTQETSFDETDIVALQAMADQIAVAIDNARLFSQTESALEEVQIANRRYLSDAWAKFLAAKPAIRAEYTQPGARVTDREFLRQVKRAAMVHERAVAQDGPVPESVPQTALAVPLKLRGQVIGTMTLHETRRLRPWQSGEISMAETVAEQVALSVENLRLMDDTQKRAAREQITREITDRVRRAVDIDMLLQTAVSEATAALGASGAFVQLSALPETAGDDESTV